MIVTVVVSELLRHVQAEDVMMTNIYPRRHRKEMLFLSLVETATIAARVLHCVVPKI